jgi:hypothetical protein
MTIDVNNLGTIVNDTEPNEDLEELQKKIELLEMSRINLRVTPNVFERLLKVAEFKNLTIEDYCIEVLVDSLNVSVGSPTINAPTFGQAVGKKVTGPSSGGLVERV